jgi:hypothetical protein
VAALEGEPEGIRSPSVAYLPVFARSPEEMATTRTQLAVTSRDDAIKRVLELQRMLSEPVSRPDQDKLEDELAELTASLGSLGDVLKKQEETLNAQIAKLQEGSPERIALEKQLKSLQEMEQVRAKREGRHGLIGAERLIATFISDEGQTVPLTLEGVLRSQSDTRVEYYLSDLTTPNSDDATATGATRTEAILTALRMILEGIHGYGRGYCSISLDGQIQKLRIEASEGSILMEAIESVATALSIAAVVAAPFTGGASLSLLIPIGAIGAIPSAYRLASRLEAGTFRFDMQTAMYVPLRYANGNGYCQYRWGNSRRCRIRYADAYGSVGASCNDYRSGCKWSWCYSHGGADRRANR